MSGLTVPLAVGIGVYALIALVMFGCQRSFLYFPDKAPLDAASLGETGLEAVELDSEPGLRLTHLYRPPNPPDGPVVVLFHGNGGHAGHRVGKFRDLLGSGIGVFFAEYRGYGGNPGSPDEPGITADAHAVMSFLLSAGLDAGRIVIYGESLGTGPATKMAVDYPVAGLILEAPYSSVGDVAQAHYWYLPARWLVLDRWEVAGRIAEVAAPVLIVHGERDRVIPVRFGRQVFEQAREPKAALFHPRAGHNDLFDHPEVVARVAAFIHEQVPAAAARPDAVQGATD